MKRGFALCLYLILTAVILSEARRVWVALSDRDRCEAVFPGAVGAIFYVAVVTSVCAGADAVAGVAVPEVGHLGKSRYWSIVDCTCHPLGGPRSSQIIILCATFGVLIFSLVLPERFRR